VREPTGPSDQASLTIEVAIETQCRAMEDSGKGRTEFAPAPPAELLSASPGARIGRTNLRTPPLRCTRNGSWEHRRRKWRPQHVEARHL
jgi:hypothetical protein